MKIRTKSKDGARGGRTGNVMVGYPVGNSVTLPFHESILGLIDYEMLRGRLSRVVSAGSVVVDANRMRLVDAFLKGGRKEEWLLQIDTDVSFPPDLIETLLRLAGDNKKVLAASVPSPAAATGGYRLVGAAADLRFSRVSDTHPDPYEVDGVGFSAVLVHREVFEAIARQQGACWFHQMHVEEDEESNDDPWPRYRTIGEDLAFCVRAKAAGYSVWCVNVPGVGHHKAVRLTHDEDGGPDGEVSESASRDHNS